MQKTQAKPTPSLQKRIDNLAEKIRETLAEYNHLISRSAAKAFELGALLSEAKKSLGSMPFSRWCLVEFNMTRPCAHRYITMYENREAIESHEDFGNLNVMQMFDVARDKKPRDRSYKVCGAKIDILLDSLESRISGMAGEHPELSDILGAIQRWRVTLYRCGLLRNNPEIVKD